MQARLFCKTGPLSGSTFAFQEEATIGKNPGNSVQITAAVISGKHARIYFDQQRMAFFVEDLKSRNGTWVDGVRVLQKERLERLSVISFAGSFDFIFQVVESVAKETKESKRGTEESVSKPQPVGKTIFDSEPVVTPAMQFPWSDAQPAIEVKGEPIQSPVLNPVSQGTPGPGRATQFDDGSATPPVVPLRQTGSDRQRQPERVHTLEIQLPKGKPQIFTLKEGESVIGRDGSCDIVVNDSSISRRHAVITVGPESIMVRDLGSKNHTFVNDKIIEAEVALGSASRITFGSVKARIQERT